MATLTMSGKRSVQTKRSRTSTARRAGRPSRSTRGSGRSWKKIVGIVAAAVLAVVVAGVSAMKITDIIGGGEVASIIFDQATSTAQSIEMTGALEDLLRQAADEHGSVRLIGVDGDGKLASSEAFDMTPKLENGTVLKVEARAEEATVQNIALVAAKINDTSSSHPGRAMFLGLTHLQIDTSRPIVIISSLLDVTDPLDMRQLGWDVSPEQVVSDIEAAGELPNLKGANITFIVRPVAGDQDQLRQPHIEYRESLIRALMVASGAVQVRFEYVDGTGSTSTVAGPVVPVPPPPTTPVPVNTPEPAAPDADPAAGEPRTCVVDTSTYFAPDSDRLLDPAGTKDALRECVAQIGPDSSVRVVGHTAGVDPDSRVALDLSTKRAEAIATLLEDLGIKRGSIKAEGSGNRDQPHPDPRDPRNRSVVVTITGN